MRDDEFTFQIVEIEDGGHHRLRAGADNISVARAAFDQLCQRYRDRRLLLLHGGYICARHEPDRC